MEQAKPPVLYHGSDNGAIAEFEPRERYKPSEKNKPSEKSGAAVYASDLPAFAAAHSFPWSSDEGFDSPIDQSGYVTLVVPERFKERLARPVFIYRLPSDVFDWNRNDGTEHTLSSPTTVRPLGVERFESVAAAVRHFGGEVVFIS